MPSDCGSAWSPPASNSERRLSNSSDGSAGSGYSKTTSDSADFLATRPHTAAVIPGKPAANPLQFVRVGPADLGSRAREQLRKAELAKRTEPARIERQEDWQSNLDNWKSSRRKRVEHIIERCVEVRRMENEPTQPRAKSKTFNEMLEERAGRRRKNHLALYTEDDSHDLSDLGIGTSSTKSSLSEDCDTHSLASDGMDLDKHHSDVDNLSNCGNNCGNNRKFGSSANEYDTCTTTTISSPEPEEYTYEGAIEGYKSRIISQTNSNIVKTVVNNNLKEKSPDKGSADLNRIRTTVSNKIEEKLTSFQQERHNDVKNNNQNKDLPKVDIHKRREQFERENSQELLSNKPKLPEISNKTSIKERLSSLEKFTEEKQIQKSTSDLNKLPVEVKPLKERLSCLEKVKSGSFESEKTKRLSNGDLSSTKSLKDRLSSLKSQTSEEELKTSKTDIKQVSMSLKERLSCLDAAKNKEIPKISVEEEIVQKIQTQIKLEDDMKVLNTSTSLKTSITGIESQMQSFCRSLDSLDINDQSSPNSFERVQSLEDFDCADLQNNTVPSDIETEDSGIHTARDSCAPPDDIADLTQVASPIGEPMIEVSEYESSNEDGVSSETVKLEEPAVKQQTSYETIITDVIIEEVEEPDTKTDNSDSASNYMQAVSQPEELSVTEEVTEIQMDKEDDDTLKSLDNQDTSVLDALEMAFQELDSEDNLNIDNSMDDTKVTTIKTETKVTFLDNAENKGAAAPLYENVNIISTSCVEELGAFPLDLPARVLEPPKEKPPPPPVEDSPEDELLGNGNFKHTNSTRRIKKEIRNKRTSFLGLDGQVDDSYLDIDLKLAPRPDITSFLQEETKIEKLLYKKTLSHDMDAKLRESRDSGVDIDRGPSAEAWYKQSSPDTSNSHSRQNSEPYTHVTVTSDEEESTKKQNQQFTSDLQNKLNDLTEPLPESKIDNLDKKIQQQQEVLRFERELLQLEQEELRRQRDNLIRDQTRIIQKSVQDIPSVQINHECQHQPIRKNQNHRHSMPNLLINDNYAIHKIYDESEKRKPLVSEEHMQRHFGVEESRKVLYDDRIIESARITRPPQPILPPKPRTRESIEREITMRSSRIPSAVEKMEERNVIQLRQKQANNVNYNNNNVNTNNNNQNYQQMTRHTLQALSAAPTPKLISNMEWLQSRSRKPANYNYNQHWLVQEAEQRRIEESRMKMRSTQRHSYQDPPTRNMHPLNSQQHLLQDYKRLVRSDPPIRPEIIPRPDLPIRHEMTRPDLPIRHDVPRPDLPIRHDISRPDLLIRHDVIKPELPIRNDMLRSDPNLRHDLTRPEPPIRHDMVRPEPPVRKELRAPVRDMRQDVKRQEIPVSKNEPREDKMLSVSGKRKCSHCGEELGRGAAMIIESLSLCYHVWCFTCAVCGAALGDGRAGADVRVRASRLHCHHCYSGDDGRKYSCV